MINLKEVVDILEKVEDMCGELEKTNLGCALQAQIKQTYEMALDYYRLTQICEG